MQCSACNIICGVYIGSKQDEGLLCKKSHQFPTVDVIFYPAWFLLDITFNKILIGSSQEKNKVGIRL
jgi:hypothetical protein